MRNRWLGFIVVGLALAVSLWGWLRLPASVPTHWNVRGQVDGYSPRWVAALVLPAGLLALRLVFSALPRLDPLRRNYPDFIDTYWLIVNAILLFMLAFHVVVILNGIGDPINLARLVPIGLGLLLVVFGNVLTRVRPNWFMGIRTPWTLSSEAVWRKTHRLGGWTMVAAGLLMMLATLLPVDATIPVLVAAVVAGALVPVVYSYVLWRKESP